MSHKQDRLLKYLNDFGSITSYEAIRELGDTRLSATIFDLKQKGVNIADVWEESKNRWGETIRYKKYFLVDGKLPETNFTPLF